MSDCCPHCGQPLSQDDIRVDLEAGIVGRNGQIARFTTHEAKVFAALFQAKGRLVTRDAMMEEVYGLEGRDWPDWRTIDVRVFAIRKKIKPLGLTVKTHWGRGYALGGGKMSSLVADAVREQLESIRERAAAAVVSEDVYAKLIDTVDIALRPSLQLHAGEWFIVDARGDILKLNGDRARAVSACLLLRAAGVIG